MVFSSLTFLFLYLPVVLLIYYLCPRKYRNAVLLIFSLVFYGWGEPLYITIMLFSTALDYVCGYFVGKYRQSNVRRARIALAVSMIGNLGMLGFFKYSGFLVENLAMIPGLSGLTAPSITLPIGISFYTFQSMSYTIDVYRGDAPVQKNILNFGAYVTLFPQLVAGPIVRYKDIAAQMNERRETLDQFASGVQLFCVGMAKKVLLANQFGILWEQFKAVPPSQLSVVGAWVGIVAYALQIYFDFSGYSDMAIGLGRMFGFEFPINFNYPYIAKSITDFWRRWHITLSSWFREYVYIPLGGNRKGLPRTYLNLFVVWMLTGFWHGASWNFIIWGIYFAVLLMVEKAFLLRGLQKAPAWVGHLYTLLMVLISWVFFSIDSLPQAGAYLAVMFGGGASLIDAQALHGLLYWAVLFAVGGIAATPLGKQVYQKFLLRFPRLEGWLAPALCVLVLLVCTACFVDSSYNPFLYFRF
ncbi:MAG: MBOAT family protein [Eubacteriales bacterium]|nr:MBOAT family protein [Eubacteriales bacterium]